MGNTMLKCTRCKRNLTDKEALTHKNAAGEREIICPECFEAATGVDYKTFAYRREVAKQTFFATLFCFGATIYAFVEKGPMYGAAGLVLTALIFFFAGKAR